MTLQEHLARAEEIAKKATPGPWHIGHIDEHLDHADVDALNGECVAEVFHRENQGFISHFSPDYVIKLIAVARVADRFACDRHFHSERGLDPNNCRVCLLEAALSALTSE